jgi:thymidylate synthase
MPKQYKHNLHLFVLLFMQDPLLHEETQYLDLIKRVIREGSLEQGRNGNTYSVFGHPMSFSLQNNVLPVLTSKRVAFKTCLKELLWFIRGSTDNTILQKNGVRIWDANGTREFLDSRGLTHYDANDLGPVYGHQWRHFNAEYTDCHADYSGQGVDQLQQIIDQLKDPATRTSRRLVMSAWNPCQLNEMALPPCHILAQFNVSHGNRLSCALYQRSGDIGLGVPFNILSYSLFTHLIAHHCGLVADKFCYFLGNAHIYDDHLEPLKEQIERTPYPFPTIEIARPPQPNIEDYVAEDFILHNYECHETIKMQMRA